MKKVGYYAFLMGVVVVLIAGSGCAKKRGGKNGMMAGGDLVGGIPGSEIGSMESLGDFRFDEGAAYGGQFEPVLFAYDSSQIDGSERGKIEAVADVMNTDAAVLLIIEGHSDERGSREYNMALGERRALAVRAYLIGLGVDGARVQTKSFGEENPLAFGHDDASWQMNRRGEFVLQY